MLLYEYLFLQRSNDSLIWKYTFYVVGLYLYIFVEIVVSMFLQFLTMNCYMSLSFIFHGMVTQTDDFKIKTSVKIITHKSTNTETNQI